MDKSELDRFINESHAATMIGSPCLHEWLAVSTGIRICKVCECELSPAAFAIYSKMENEINHA